MGDVAKLTGEALETALQSLPHWKPQDNKLVRTTTFASFLRAISFVNALAHLAERQNHHPDIAICYHRVTVSYWTHRAKGLTELDILGAREAEALIGRFKDAEP